MTVKTNWGIFICKFSIIQLIGTQVYLLLLLTHIFQTSVRTSFPVDNDGLSHPSQEVAIMASPGNFLSISSLPQALWEIQDKRSKPFQYSLYQACSEHLPVFQWAGGKLEDDLVSVFLTQSSGSAAQQLELNHLTILSDVVLETQETDSDLLCPAGFKLCKEGKCQDSKSSFH